MSQPEHRYALPIGYRLHWYEVRGILGQGGFGVTYLAQDLNLDRPVAIKEYLPSDFALRDSEDTVRPVSDAKTEIYAWGLDRFIKEARTLSRFEHPNIVRVYAVFEENNTGYMAMAYERGRSFRAIIEERKTLPEKELLAVILPILDGLEQVHAHGFIHRDIKPDNIYIRDDGSPVLLDFGSARQNAGSDKTTTSLVSPGYAPFEQYYAKGEEQGPWTDIYSLGATLFHAAAGRKLSDAVYRSRDLIERREEEQESETLRQLPGFSREFLYAVDHAIQFKAQDRPQSVAEWRGELEHSASDDETRLLSQAEQIAAVPAFEHAASGNQGGASGFSLKTRALAVTGAALLLVLLVIGYGEIDLFGTEDKRVVVASEDRVAAMADTRGPTSDAKDDLRPPPVTAPNAVVPRQNDISPTEPEQAEDEAGAEGLRLSEKARLANERQEAEVRRVAEEKQARETARLAQAKQEQEARENRERERIAQQRLAELEERIERSRLQLATRSAKALDAFEYVDSPTPVKLKEISSSFEIAVPAASSKWVSSGVALERGKRYRVTGAGTWKLGKACRETDATGEGMYTLGCWDGPIKTVPGIPHGALIAKLGKETLAFHIGTELEFTAIRNGVLYFLSNDGPLFLWDNSGALQVTVQLLGE